MAYVSTKLRQEFKIEEIVTVHYFEYMKNFIFSGESHDFWEILYVDKGRVIVADEYNTYVLNTGDIIFHKPNAFHAIKSIGDNSPNLVAISFLCHSPSMSYFEKYNGTLNMQERVLISQIIEESSHSFITPLNLPAVEQVKIDDLAPFGSQQMILLNLIHLLIEIKRNHLTHEDDSVPKIISPTYSSTKANRINKITDYMEEHLCEQLTIHDLCLLSSLSRSSLHTLFSKEKGCGAIEYFNKLKIDYAKDVIRSGVMNFTELAHYLSYGSLQYFSKQFKKSTGMSPLVYSQSVKEITYSISRLPIKKE